MNASALEELGDSASLFLLDLVLKGGIWLALVTLAERLCGRRYAAWRSLVWRMSVIGLLLIPLVPRALPRLRVPVLPPRSRSVVAEAAFHRRPHTSPYPAAIASAVSRDHTPSVSRPAAWAVRPTAKTSRPSALAAVARQWPVAALAAYVLGACAVLVRLALALTYVSSLRRSLVAVEDSDWLGRLRAWRAQLRVHRTVRLAASEEVRVPTQIGVVAPVIVVPASILRCSDSTTRDAVLVHELAHVRRWDYLFNLLSTVALSLHWPNPLCWVAVARLREANEDASDDWCVEQMGDPHSYGRRLLDMTSEMQATWGAAALGMGAVTGARIGKRLRRIAACGGEVSPRVRPLTGSVVALMLAGSAVILGISTCANRETPKPSSIAFVKRWPRLVRLGETGAPLEPKLTRTQRTVGSAKADVGREQVASRVEPSEVVPDLAEPSARVGRVLMTREVGLEIESLSEEPVATMGQDESVDTSVELVDVDGLDTGKHHALVVQDPEDKRNLRGFCRLSWLYIPRIHDSGANPQTWLLLRTLAEAMNEYTSIETRVGRRISIGDPEALRIPWVYHVCPFAYQLSDGELAMWGQYLVQGGFIFADPGSNEGQEAASRPSHLRNLLAALQTQGIRTALERIADGHPIYHSYFDFSGPPIGPGSWRWDGAPYLEGLEVGDRLVAVLSRTGYQYSSGAGTERQRQFGVNLIVFALTQEGSITRRLMASIGEQQ